MSAATDKPVYVVLGATGGVGSEVSRRLAAGNASLMLGARDPDRLADLAGALGAQSQLIEANHGSTIDACVTQAKETFGRLDGVVNCLGTLLLKPAHLTTDEEWAHTMQVNLTSAFVTVRAATRNLSSGNGSIVLVSSAAAKLGLANHEAIAAAKAGVEGLVRSAASSYGHRGIRVNAVAPGMVRTPLTQRITSNEKALEASTRMHVLGRVGEPREVASAITWLLNPEQSWVTGQVIGVDGGLGSVRSRA